MKQFTDIATPFANVAETGELPGQDLPWLKTLRQDALTHVIESGDTLSEIAVRYRVSFKSLKDFNGLRNDTIRLGQTLKIPPG